MQLVLSYPQMQSAACHRNASRFRFRQFIRCNTAGAYFRF